MSDSQKATMECYLDDHFFLHRVCETVPDLILDPVAFEIASGYLAVRDMIALGKTGKALNGMVHKELATSKWNCEMCHSGVLINPKSQNPPQCMTCQKRICMACQKRIREENELERQFCESFHVCTDCLEACPSCKRRICATCAPFCLGEECDKSLLCGKCLRPDGLCDDCAHLKQIQRVRSGDDDDFDDESWI